MASCEKAAQWHHALGLYEKMTVVAVAADVVSFSALVSSLGKLGKWKDVRVGDGCGCGEFGGLVMKNRIIPLEVVVTLVIVTPNWEGT